jgi:hypothetical protein
VIGGASRRLLKFVRRKEYKHRCPKSANLTYRRTTLSTHVKKRSAPFPQRKPLRREKNGTFKTNTEFLDQESPPSANRQSICERESVLVQSLKTAALRQRGEGLYCGRHRANSLWFQTAYFRQYIEYEEVEPCCRFPNYRVKLIGKKRRRSIRRNLCILELDGKRYELKTERGIELSQHKSWWVKTITPSRNLILSHVRACLKNKVAMQGKISRGEYDNLSSFAGKKEKRWV